MRVECGSVGFRLPQLSVCKFDELATYIDRIRFQVVWRV